MMTIRLVSVQIKKDHPYSLFFTFIKSDERFDNTYEMKYTGANVIIPEFDLDEAAKEKITNQLQTVFGNGEYDEEIVQERFENMERLIKW